MKNILIVALLIFLIGCSGEPKTIKECKDLVLKCEKNALDARQSKDADKAEGEAEKALEIAEELEERLEDAKDVSESDLKQKEEILILANKTKHIADLSREDEELADLLSSWKALAYRKTTVITLKGVFLGLALASDQAESKGLDKLPGKIKESVEWSASLVHDYTGKGKLENGDPDWKEISKILREFAKDPPLEFQVFCAFSSTLASQNELALISMELVDASKIQDKDRKLTFQILRSIVLSLNGFSNLAVESLETALNETDSETDGDISQKENSRRLLSAIHMLMGYVHFQDKKYEEADKELARAIKAWPNNPLSVFLTGEILLENGKKEEAAESLEKAATNVESKWLAKLIAKRAKEIRDGTGKNESLVYNTKVMGGILLTFMIDNAKKSNNNPSLVKWLELIRDYSGKLMGFEMATDTEEEEIAEETTKTQ